MSKKAARGAGVKNGWRRMHRKRLQREVMMDIVEHGLSEHEAETKYRLRSGSITRWFGDERFRGEMACMMEAASWNSHVLIAHGACIAVKRLVALTKCKKEETRRKACLDVIAMLHRECSGKSKDQFETPPLPFSEETASKLLAVLAGEDEQPAGQPDDRQIPEPPAAEECPAG